MLEEGDGIDLVQCFNPRSNQWTELASMLIARSGSAACVLNNHIYVIGRCEPTSIVTLALLKTRQSQIK